MGSRVYMAAALLLVVLTTCICTEAALLRKGSAVDFLTRGRREQRSAEDSNSNSNSDGDSDGDSNGDSNSEVEELPEGPSDYDGFTPQMDGGSELGETLSPDSEAVTEDGSGM